MGDELDKPILSKNPIDGKSKMFRFGINTVQGWKKTMEVFNIKENNISSEDKNLNIFGIFEGHSGNEISQYLSLNFTSDLLKNENFINNNYKQALIDTFKNIDISLRTEEINNKLKFFSHQNNLEQKQKIEKLYKKIDNKNKDENDLDDINNFMEIIDPQNLEGTFISDFVGSSGLVILIDEKTTYVANAGNSHFIILNKNYSIINDKNFIEQNVYNNNEKKRIKISQGIKYGKEKEKLFKNEEYLYTRGFGNFQYKNNNLISEEEQEIIAIPDFFEIENKDIKLLIICNSGFFQSGVNLNNNSNNYIYKYSLNKYIERNIASYFVQKIQNEPKIISDIIGDYFEEFISHENKNNNFNNFSCTIIDFFDN